MRNIRRGGLVAVALMVAALSTACGSDDGSGATPSQSSGQEMTSTPMETSDSMQTSEPMETSADMAMGELVGAGCADYAAMVPDGAGSVDGMAQDPVATAASNNPLLTTLVAAVSGGVNPNVNLVDTLNGGEFTIFAPVDDAFAKLDQATLDALGADDGTLLSKVLTYHVIAGRLAPDALIGTQTTVETEPVEITGTPDALMINGTATVICGNVQTANATVYLIDTVLMPPSMM
jgi:uncharacterized surface protein with fasciclin (FAS1) repeats